MQAAAAALERVTVDEGGNAQQHTTFFEDKPPSHVSNNYAMSTKLQILKIGMICTHNFQNVKIYTFCKALSYISIIWIVEYKN
jgi:hypothetical protein